MEICDNLKATSEPGMEVHTYKHSGSWGRRKLFSKMIVFITDCKIQSCRKTIHNHYRKIWNTKEENPSQL
jgi:hypothetical protein